MFDGNPEYKQFMQKLIQNNFYNKKQKRLRIGSKKKAIKEKYKQLMVELKKLTDWLPDDYSDAIRFIYLRNGLTGETGLCPVCGEPRFYEKGRSRFYYTCGKKDIAHKKYMRRYVVDKAEETLQKKYGVHKALQCKKFKRKQEETNLNRYGVKHAAQSEEIKKKTKNIFIKNWGVENPNQCEEVKQKIRKTNLQKYNVPYYTQSEEYKKRLPEIKQKIHTTCLQKYDTIYYAQSESYRNKLPEINKKLLNTKHPNINYERWSSLTKEFIEKNFIDSDNHLMVQKLMDYVGWETPTSVYQKCHELGVKWTHNPGGGFDHTKAATLYYIYDPQEDMYKIGITNNNVQTRFGKDFCSKRAIAILEQWEYQNGYEAYLAEQEILNAFQAYRCTNPSWPEEVGGRTEFFSTNVLRLKEGSLI